MNKFILFVVAFLSIQIGFSQCPSSPIVLTTQIEVDNFTTTYPNCTILTNSLTISGSDITDLSSLSGIIEVENLESDVIIESNAMLTSLSGLESLQKIDGHLRISNNPVLDNLMGLSSLIELGNDLTIQENSLLTSLDGLENLVVFTEGISILENPILSSITGLSGISGTIRKIIIRNSMITNLNGLEGLTDVGYGVFQDRGIGIQDNELLESLDGIENVTTAGFLDLQSNEVLNDIAAADGLTLLNGFIIIANPSITSMPGFNNLLEIEGALQIINNDALVSINGFQNLAIIPGISIRNNEVLTSLPTFQPMDLNGVTISGNNSLTSLSGLEAIQSTSVGLEIAFNPILTDITALSNLNILPECDIEIKSNDFLSFCSIMSVCDRLDMGGTGDIEIADNALGCNSEVEVLNICQGNTCPGNDVLLSSQADVDAFASIYPGCTTLNYNLTISGSDITDLSGLTQITEMTQGLIIQDNAILTDISGLNAIAFSGGNSHIIVENNAVLNSLSGLNGATSNNISITIKNNPSLSTIASLLGLTSSGYIEIDNNDALLNLSGLEGLTLVDVLFIYNNELLSDISGLSNITGFASNLEIGGNPSLISLSGLEGYTDVMLDLIVVDNALIQDLNGLSGLTNASTSPNSTNVIIQGNNVLTDINGLADLNHPTVHILEIRDNPLLSICEVSSVCNYLNDGGDAVIQDNAAGCDGIAEVVNACGLDLNVITGNIKFDFDEDGCDPADFNAQSILVNTTDGTNSYGTSPNAQGDYTFLIGLDGTFTTSIVTASLPPLFNVSPLSVESTFVGYGNGDVVDFCLTAMIFDDLNIVILPLNDARPGFNSFYKIVYQNVGTNLASGEIALEFDISRQNFLFANPNETEINGNTIRWDYSNLLPFESGSITVAFNNLPPPTNNSGDILSFVATISPETDDVTPEDNTYTLEQVIINSQDPNDKLVLQGEEMFLNEVGGFLDYIVRFQNIGTASAINVRVEDVLTENLNEETFRIIDASHEYELQIVNGNEVSFIFDGINLPSVDQDPEGSQGFIAFRIKTEETLLVGDIVENQADIYFDFNAPIETNVAIIEVVDNLSVFEVELENSISLYPNPASEEIFIEMLNGAVFESAQLYSVLGVLVGSTSEAKLNLENLSEGIYFVKINTNTGQALRRIVVE
tara:strand:+ start:646 stop:4137 length:3492 start_codon:yes stop_codon:yes gene_type:complete